MTGYHSPSVNTGVAETFKIHEHNLKIMNSGGGHIGCLFLLGFLVVFT